MSNWGKNVFSGGMGALKLAFVVVAVPAFLTFKGCQNAMEDNPEGKNDPTTSEYHKHNVDQFLEGASLGVYDVEDGVTPESVVDAAAEGTKTAIDWTKRASKQLDKRLPEVVDSIDNEKSQKAKDLDEACDTLDEVLYSPECQ
jgi:hypothetical protein